MSSTTVALYTAIATSGARDKPATVAPDRHATVTIIQRRRPSLVGGYSRSSSLGLRFAVIVASGRPGDRRWPACPGRRSAYETRLERSSVPAAVARRAPIDVHHVQHAFQ
jgi:hypothetical protein